MLKCEKCTGPKTISPYNCSRGSYIYFYYIDLQTKHYCNNELSYDLTTNNGKPRRKNIKDAKLAIHRATLIELASELYMVMVPQVGCLSC